MSLNSEVLTLINKLYGNEKQCISYLAKHTGSIPTVMGTSPRNQRELADIRVNHYRPVKAAEDDSHRFSYDTLGYPEDAINNAKQDIHDIQRSETAQRSDRYQAGIKSDQAQIKRAQQMPSDELVLISQTNNGKIVRPARPSDIEMIYHNTHYSNREIIQRHPDVLAYVQSDAEIDAKRDLQQA